MVIEALAQILGQLLNRQGVLIGMWLGGRPLEAMAGDFFHHLNEVLNPDEMAKTDADVGITPMPQGFRQAFAGLFDPRRRNRHPELQGEIIL